MVLQLGTCVDGRALTYDVTLYEFRLARELVMFDDVRDLDANGHIRWCAPEQRDWFRRINPVDLAACNRNALARTGNSRYANMTPEERVQADAARDDSVLAGKIVDADPALVQAVVAQLEEQGLLGGMMMPGQAAQFNPLAAANLPKGMEALSQFERHAGADRKMTSAEKRLMKKILKNDDKEKARREKMAARSGASQQDEQEAAAATGADVRAATAPARMTSTAMNVVAANPQHYRFPEITYTDSAGNPIRPAADAVRPDMEQLAEALSDEERALNEMRERNRKAEAEAAGMMTTDVPGMQQAKGKRRANLGARINGVDVNPDGSPKQTAFKKFLGGLGEVVDTVAPLAGGGRGGGGGGGMGGGAGGGAGGGGMGR